MPGEEIKARVISASRVVFTRSGYRGATVQEIIEEAGIARATFYKYFSGKRQVFSELISAFLKILYNTARDYMLTETDDTEVFIDRISESLVLFYTLFLENRELMSAYFQEVFVNDPGLSGIWDEFDRDVTLVFSRMLKKGIESGTLRPMNTDLVASALLLVFLQVPYREIMGGRNIIIDVSSMANEMARFAVEGLTRRGAGAAGPREDPLP